MSMSRSWNVLFKNRNRIKTAAIVAAAVYMIFEIVSLVEDRRNGVSVWSILFEMMFNLAAVGGCLYLFEVLLRIKGESNRLESRMLILEQENLDWKNRTSTHVKGLNQAIDEQLSAWELSPAEKEIALLLLKGITNREIAGIRKTSEHTIKQQASAVYRKAGFKTRGEMSAFFLGDLLEPAKAPVPPPPDMQI